MIKKWIDKFKQKQEQEKIKRETYIQRRKSEAKAEEEKSNDLMTHEFCPIREGKCTVGCVHFKSARFFYSDDKMFEGVYGYKAGCKLWGDN